ncbi:hypothetical protein ACL9RI_23185 [Janthinobacterium sp. Mn2066]|uniref:hypothetical protein n=1 Tax=Janthinobacterium sp. Mn2066 TaxID=3395264 RepID=UPI003BC097B0
MDRWPGPRLRMHARQRGAALLLLVTVLALGAATLLMTGFSPQVMEQRRVEQTQRTLAQSRDALIGFALQHGRLPRPAVSAQDGRESNTACASDADCSGFLPWVALGVGQADSWGNVLRYSVTPAFTQAPIKRNEVLASKTIQTRGTDGNVRYVYGDDLCGRGACSPAVIFSTGKHNFGTSVQGVQQRSGNLENADERSNDQATQHFITRQATDNSALPGGAFDDMLVYLPLPTLLTRMVFADKLD